MPFQRKRRRTKADSHRNNSKQSQDTTHQSTSTTTPSSGVTGQAVLAKAIGHHHTHAEEVTQVGRELSGLSLSGAPIQSLTFIQAHGDISKLMVLLIDDAYPCLFE
jgi:hypothetical protein